jgi:hypothetical protein
VLTGGFGSGWCVGLHETRCEDSMGRRGFGLPISLGFLFSAGWLGDEMCHHGSLGQGSLRSKASIS